MNGNAEYDAFGKRFLSEVEQLLQYAQQKGYTSISDLKGDIRKFIEQGVKKVTESPPCEGCDMVEGDKITLTCGARVWPCTQDNYGCKYAK